MNSIFDLTLDDIKAAAEWAITARDMPQKIDGTTRLYEQSHWECGTSCCILGAAWLIKFNEPYPCWQMSMRSELGSWATKTPLNRAIFEIMAHPYKQNAPEKILELIANADLALPTEAIPNQSIQREETNYDKS